MRDFLLNWDGVNLHARAIFDSRRMVTMHLLWYCLQVDISCKLVEVKFLVFLYRILNLFQFVNMYNIRRKNVIESANVTEIPLGFIRYK